MSVTIEDIKTQLPEFAALATSQIQLALDRAERRINTTQWGSKADDATICLVGHLLALTCPGGSSAGAATSEKVGDVSASYALPEVFKRSAMARTSHGRCYLELLALVMPSRCC